MARPSIFSREYERKMRRRKRRAAIILICLICSAGIFLEGGNLRGMFKSNLVIGKNFNFYGLLKGINKDNKQIATKVNKDIDEKNLSRAADNTVQPQNVEDKGYDISLNGGNKVKAVYEENKDGVKRFKYITPMEGATFNINPSGTGMIILDNNTQSMIYVDIDGTARPINDFKYVSSKGDEFPKEEILKANENYIWCSSPRFVDDNYVAYISQLPWFNSKNTKYIWVVNAKDPNIKDRNNHICLENLSGDNLKIGNISDKGLEIDTDNGVRYIKFNGQSIDISQ